MFHFNKQFSSPSTVIRLKVVPHKETEKESTIQDEYLRKGRMIKIDASIIRIMKARKTALINDLITEVTKHLSSQFMLNPTMIKKQIENLIEREYLQRDSAD